MAPNRLKMLLIVSLVFNVFLLGTVAGGTYQWIAKQKADVVAQQRGLRFAAAELSKDRRKELRRAIRQTRMESLPLIADARNGRLEVAQVLAAPEFDRAALDAALARTREADIAWRARVETTVADFAAALTPEERLKLVDAMERHGPLHVAEPAKK